MEKAVLQKICDTFNLDGNTTCKAFGNGLINNTYLLTNSKKYILQKINTEVFKQPDIIANNIQRCSDHFTKNHPDYLFIRPVKTITGSAYYIENSQYWRLIPFVENSITFNKLDNPDHAFEAARAVGEFAKVSRELNVANFGETIPQFHDLGFRFQQFKDALQKGNQSRIDQNQSVINEIMTLSHICDTFEAIKINKRIPLRIQHHDTKINNILFDQKTGKSICLCDLDTIMPGYFISDLGDMMRTYLSEANEEEQDFSKVKVRKDYYDALMAGYLSQMGTVLTQEEKKFLHYAGEFLIFMQALRFFTDYLNNDTYYATSYPEHNLNRTLNQLKLLKEYNTLG